jgi:Fur family transcriptional regulator, ferric uptake regulator
MPAPLELIRKAGYKYTTPRRIVAEVLEAHRHHHLSANEVWEAVKKVDNSIGRMSVYRALELFTEVGYIRPASQNASDARNGLVYVVMQDGHHHHIICQQCRRVIEFEDCGLDQLVQTLEEKYGFVIDGHLLEFFGICADCQPR